ncbi:MAG: hypothetical protein K0R49_1127, partial [Burkholderiales bacterium]|nr:hypothetical protein [Burkholderiales bacterium]
MLRLSKNYFVIILIFMFVGFNSSALTIIPESKGTTYDNAQTITQLDKNHFAVGKWDGTIQIIKSTPKSKPPYAPTVIQTISLNNGVQMLANLDLDNGIFISSNGNDSLIIWHKNSRNKYESSSEVRYDDYAPDAGIANSGTSVFYNGTHYFISGHENGYIIIWQFTEKNILKYIKTVDIQSKTPISNPYNLKNIRGLSPWRDGMFVTGSEDGDLVLLNIRGETLYRTRYNSTAQMGINQTAILGDYLLVANCESGMDDKNLWLYHLTNKKIDFLDSLNLKSNKSLLQVFNFSVAMGEQRKQTLFFASTQEGIIWYGFISNNKLKVDGQIKNPSPLGSALYYNSI